MRDSIEHREGAVAPGSYIGNIQKRTDCSGQPETEAPGSLGGEMGGGETMAFKQDLSFNNFKKGGASDFWCCLLCFANFI